MNLPCIARMLSKKGVATCTVLSAAIGSRLHQEEENFPLKRQDNFGSLALRAHVRLDKKIPKTKYAFEKKR